MVKTNNKKLIAIIMSLAMISTSFIAPVNVFGETPQDAPVQQKPITTVTFNPNGGKVSTKTKQVQYSSIYGVLPKPTRSKYTFKGWFTKAKGGSEITQYSTVHVTANSILYARWQKTTSYEKEVVKHINKERKKRKLVKLKWDKKLRKGTNIRAKEITKKFSHTRPNGGSGARLLLKYVKKGRSSGECLGKGFTDTKKLVDAFMDSPTHKRIIMMKKGRTCAVSSRISGTTTYWVVGTSAKYK